MLATSDKEKQIVSRKKRKRSEETAESRIALRMLTQLQFWLPTKHGETYEEEEHGRHNINSIQTNEHFSLGIFKSIPYRFSTWSYNTVLQQTKGCVMRTCASFMS
jgi:hypothetical protein